MRGKNDDTKNMESVLVRRRCIHNRNVLGELCFGRTSFVPSNCFGVKGNFLRGGLTP